MLKWRCILVLMLTALIVAACGGGDNKTKESGTPGGQQSGTLEPTSLYPPTLTPGPTFTQPPHVTIEYTYEAPTVAVETAAPVIFPTRPPFTPLPPPPSAPPSKVDLVITADRLDDLLGLQLGVLTSYLQSTPNISFENGLVRAALTVYTTPSDSSTARPVVIEASAALNMGSIRLDVQSITFADDHSPYEDTLSDYILGTIQTAINDLVRQIYLDQYPGAGNYTITHVTVTDTGITVEVTQVT
jgi:hypothetical protein